MNRSSYRLRRREHRAGLSVTLADATNPSIRGAAESIDLRTGAGNFFRGVMPSQDILNVVLEVCVELDGC